MGKSKKPPKPQKVEAGQEIGEYLFGSNTGTYKGVTDPRLLEGLIGSEKEFRPQFAALELGDIETMLLGMNGQGGLLDLMDQSTRRSGELLRSERSLDASANADLINQYGSTFSNAVRQANPFADKIARLQYNQASNLYNEGEGTLSPERARMAQQASRQAGVARGRINDSSSIANELLGREGVRSQLRNEARQSGSLAYDMNTGLDGGISSYLLGMNTPSMGYGGSLLSSGQSGAYQTSGAQLFDPNVGINLGLQHNANMNNYRNALAQSGGNYGDIGSMLGTAAGAAIGTLIMPGVGTAAGASIGGGLGGAAGTSQEY